MDGHLATVSMATLLLLTTALIEGIDARGPPTLLDSNYQRRHVVREGDHLKLTCPATSTPPPMYTWQKGGVDIGPGWEQYRVSNDVLRVKELELMDSGVFVCRATNGFGTLDVRHLVFVYGNDTILPPEDFEEDFFERKTESEGPLAFYNPGQMKPQISTTVGDTVRLTCALTGNPLPDIRWFKDGSEVSTAGEAEDDSEDKVSSTLLLSNVRGNDGGRYTCTASNSLASLNYTYVVIVKDQAESGIVMHNPRNVTVLQGESASLDCYVRSLSTPLITWYQRIDPSIDVRNSSSAIVTIHSDRYVELPGGGGVTELQRDGSYRSRLAVQRVTEREAGMYVCSATSSHGVRFRNVYLIVLPAPAQSADGAHWSDSHSPFLPIIIALASVGGAFLLAIIAFIIYRQRGAGSKPPGAPPLRPLPSASSAAASTVTTFPGRSPPDRRGDHQYSAIQGGHEREAMLPQLERGRGQVGQVGARGVRQEQLCLSSDNSNSFGSSGGASVASPLHQQYATQQRMLFQQQQQQLLQQQHFLQQQYYQQQQQLLLQQQQPNGGRNRGDRHTAYC